jgi:hypothetical protein
MASLEVGMRTTATLSCSITGLTEALTVTWLKSDGQTIATKDGFTVNEGNEMFFLFRILSEV